MTSKLLDQLHDMCSLNGASLLCNMCVNSESLDQASRLDVLIGAPDRMG